MTSPLSNFLRDLRLRSGQTQLDLARLLGYEQAYISALELGLKSPSEVYLSKLAAVLEITGTDREELDRAISRSARRFTLPAHAPAETFEFCNELWGKLERLHPAHIEAMHTLLNLDDEMLKRPRYTPGRIRRRNKVEAPM